MWIMGFEVGKHDIDEREKGGARIRWTSRRSNQGFAWSKILGSRGRSSHVYYA